MTSGSNPEDLGRLQDAGHFTRLVKADEGLVHLLDGLSDVARRVLRVPLAQVNVLMDGQQFSISSVAPGPSWAELNGPQTVPVGNSFCQHAIRLGELVLIEDAAADPLVRDSPSTLEMGIRAYAGIPLKNQEGDAVATLCVVDSVPRTWSTSDIEALTALADLLMREVRGRVAAQEALHRSEERFRSLIENGGELITVLSADGEIVYHSPAYGRILGYSDSALLGMQFKGLLHPRDVKRWTRQFLEPLESGDREPTAEWRMRTEQGTWRTVRGHGVNRLEDPAIQGFVFNLHDITQERQLESELQQAQKMEAVGRLAGGVAHDFNNLLTAIRGNTEFLLARGDLLEEVAQDIREVSEVCRRAEEVTRQLLTFSRDQVLELEALDLGKLTQELAPLVRRLIGVGITLKTSIEDDLVVEADSSQLSQVIMNLTVNARDAMPAGGTIHIDVHPFTASEDYALSHGDMTPGEYVMLSVTDDGEGMTREIQSRIFEPFFTTKDAGRGTGLGLSISWGIIKQIGGHIHLYSEPGHGTNFRIFLPRTDKNVTPASVGVSCAALLSSRPGEGTILAVDDQPDVLRIITRVLRADGYQVLEAGTAEEAWDLVDSRSTPIHLLLTDVLLPGKSGAELAWRVLEASPSTGIAFTSGFTRGELQDQRVDLRSAAFLPKPFGPMELSRFVAKTLAAQPALVSL